MERFFSELKRRHIYRVAAAYAVVAWVLLQLVNTVAPLLRLPEWAGSFFLVALLVGFPVALIFAWALELKSPGAAERGASGKADWILTAALGLVIALMLYEQLASRPGTVAQQASVSSALTTRPNGISLAVLPFANLSGDAGQEFFSDGMTEEITAALAKVQSLRVVARASAFQFKGERRDMRAVGQALGARYLIDGSVRKEGNRVRITAQLIEAENGVNVWTDSYDRELTSVFATQEDIAKAIAGALRVPLGLQQGESLVANRTSDLDSYQQFLRGKALYRSREIDRAIAVLEPAAARDPNYAPARALLAEAYARQPNFSLFLAGGNVDDARPAVQSFLVKAEMAAREAIRLDPEHAGGYVGLALFEAFRGNRWAAAEGLFRQALALDATDADTLHAYSNMLADAGYLKESLVFRQQLRTLEPFVPPYNTTTAMVMLALDQREAATRLLEAAIPSEGGIGFIRHSYLSSIYALAGRYADAADMLQSSPQTTQVSRQAIDDAVRLLRSAGQNAGTPKVLPSLMGTLEFVYFYVGAPERSLEFPEWLSQIEYYAPLEFTVLWGPEYAPLRKTERFKVFVRKAGLVDYWKARGWPDVCRPQGADDFVCD